MSLAQQTITILKELYPQVTDHPAQESFEKADALFDKCLDTPEGEEKERMKAEIIELIKEGLGIIKYECSEEENQRGF